MSQSKFDTTFILSSDEYDLGSISKPEYDINKYEIAQPSSFEHIELSLSSLNMINMLLTFDGNTAYDYITVNATKIYIDKGNYTLSQFTELLNTLLTPHNIILSAISTEGKLYFTSDTNSFTIQFNSRMSNIFGFDADTIYSSTQSGELHTLTGLYNYDLRSNDIYVYIQTQVPVNNAITCKRDYVTNNSKKLLLAVLTSNRVGERFTMLDSIPIKLPNGVSVTKFKFSFENEYGEPLTINNKIYTIILRYNLK